LCVPFPHYPTILKSQFFQVLENSDPEKDAKLLKHAEAYPLEQEPLLDSALSFGGKPRTIPLPQRTFVPVGHICLGSVLTEYERRGYAKNEEGLYWISNFYVSRALQGIGLGTAAMNTVENLAISEPLNAKILALNAINKIDPEREEKYKALGLVIPLVSVPGLKVEFANDVKFSNQEWYERRGYRVYTNVESLFSKVDSTGKTWSWNAVFMKKEI